MDLVTFLKISFLHCFFEQLFSVVLKKSPDPCSFYSSEDSSLNSKNFRCDTSLDTNIQLKFSGQIFSFRLSVQILVQATPTHKNKPMKIFFSPFSTYLFSNFPEKRKSLINLEPKRIVKFFSSAAVQVASKSLMEAMTEVYEPQWSGSEALYAQASSIEVLWQDFSHKLGDQVLIPLNTYTAQFPEMRVRGLRIFLIRSMTD